MQNAVQVQGRPWRVRYISPRRSCLHSASYKAAPPWESPLWPEARGQVRVWWSCRFLVQFPADTNERLISKETRGTSMRFSKLVLGAWPQRSEEHTSELQSLMRISYAVFCLKKKNNTRPQP